MPIRVAGSCAMSWRQQKHCMQVMCGGRTRTSLVMSGRRKACMNRCACWLAGAACYVDRNCCQPAGSIASQPGMTPLQLSWLAGGIDPVCTATRGDNSVFQILASCLHLPCAVFSGISPWRRQCGICMPVSISQARQPHQLAAAPRLECLIFICTSATNLARMDHINQDRQKAGLPMCTH